MQLQERLSYMTAFFISNNSIRKNHRSKEKFSDISQLDYFVVLLFVKWHYRQSLLLN